MKRNLTITTLFAFLFSIKILAQTPQYCASKGVFPWEQWIERISISSGNFSNSSGKDGYGNFTNLIGVTLQRGIGNLITISPKSSWNGDPRNASMFWRAWVDFNADGDFTDEGEMVISRQVVIQSQIFLDNEAAFTPPNTTLLGKTRLRIAMKVGSYPKPCEYFARGEVEDYTVNIMNPTPAGSDTLRLVGISGDRVVRQGEKITLNVTIKNTGTAPSSPNTPLSIYQNQQPFIFKGPPPTFLTVVSERTPIGRPIIPGETVTLPVTFTMFPNFSSITRPDYSGVQYNSTYVVIGNRSDNFNFFPYSYPVVDTLTVPYNINALLDSTDLKIDIIASDTTFNKNGRHSFTVKITNNGRAVAKDVLANVGTGYSQYASGVFVLPTVTPQRGTVFTNTPFGGAAYSLWNISNLAPNESLTALVQYEKFAIPVVLSEFVHEVSIASNQIIDTLVSNNMASKRFVLDTTPLPYCTSKGTAPWEQWIAGITVFTSPTVTAFPPTGKEGYADFTSLSAATAQRGLGGLISISPQSSWGLDPRNSNMFWRVWIDFNRDNDFDDAGEMVVSRAVGITNGIFFDNDNGFSVPTTALLGKTRMRVAMKVGGYPSPCETFERGEVEDFTINIVEIPPNIQRLVAQGDLKVILKDEKVRMDWVQQSFSISYFDIEKSTDSVHFKSIKNIPTAANKYHVAYDDAPTEGVSFYRLKIHLMNGETQSTNPQKVNYEKLPDFTVFPNPANDEAYIDLKKYQDKTVYITISDVAGQIILNKTIEKAISEPQKLDVSNLKNGTYFIILKSENRRNVVRKIQILN